MAATSTSSQGENPSDAGLRKRVNPGGGSPVSPETAMKVWEVMGKVLDALGPFIEKAHAFYKKMPHNAVLGISGLAMCFFGGRYALLIAAVEAFRAVGWPNIERPVKELYQEYQQISAANKDDDLEDADNDGIADVKQMDKKSLLARKVALALRTCNPEKVSDSATGVAAGLGAVLAVLQAEFAMTIALGNSVAKYLKRPCSLVLEPLLKMGIPRDYQRWVPVLINTVCKMVAIWVAWVVRAVVSGVQSAIRGGMICARAVMDELVSRKIVPGVEKMDYDNTYVDEMAGWSLAAIGAWYQLSGFFGVPALLYPFALPFDIAEGVLGWFVLTE